MRERVPPSIVAKESGISSCFGATAGSSELAHCRATCGGGGGGGRWEAAGGAVGGRRAEAVFFKSVIILRETLAFFFHVFTESGVGEFLLLALLEVERDEFLFLAAFEPLDVAFEEGKFLELRLAFETGFAEWAENFGI